MIHFVFILQFNTWVQFYNVPLKIYLLIQHFTSFLFFSHFYFELLSVTSIKQIYRSLFYQLISSWFCWHSIAKLIIVLCPSYFGSFAIPHSKAVISNHALSTFYWSLHFWVILKEKTYLINWTYLTMQISNTSIKRWMSRNNFIFLLRFLLFTTNNKSLLSTIKLSISLLLSFSFWTNDSTGHFTRSK